MFILILIRYLAWVFIRGFWKRWIKVGCMFEVMIYGFFCRLVNDDLMITIEELEIVRRMVFNLDYRVLLMVLFVYYCYEWIG